MKVWAISDLHLSFAKPGRRERYATRWVDHAAKIERNWRRVVESGDVVLIPGDLSMAGNHRDLQEDLRWLHRLPGTKVIAPGNHDRWWNNLAAVRRLLRGSVLAVEGDAVEIEGLVICGTAGAPVPSNGATSEERLEMDRQIKALENALAQADLMRGDPPKNLFVLWHFPPFDAHARPGPWVERFERAGVTACVYGHLHREREWQAAVQGVRHGVGYYCVAADAIGFQPLLIATASSAPAATKQLRFLGSQVSDSQSNCSPCDQEGEGS
jgi:predicted phosphohydrolase